MFEHLEIIATDSLLATALAIVVAVFCARTNKPAIRHCLWVLVLLRLIMPPVLVMDFTGARGWLCDAVRSRVIRQQSAIQLVWNEQVAAVRRAADAQGVVPVRTLFRRNDDGVERAKLSPPVNLTQILEQGVSGLIALLGLVWLAGSVTVVVTQVRAVYFFHRRIKSQGYRSQIWQQRADKLAAKMGLASSPSVQLVREPISPMLWGVGRQCTVLLPDQLLQQLDRRAQNALLAHELAHYRRGDHWVRMLETVATAIYWWHPVLWWVRYEIEKTEEQCCDAIAVHYAFGDRRGYAETLLTTVDFVSEPHLPPAASGACHRGILQQRLRAIMLGSREFLTAVRLGPIAWLCVACVLLPFPTFFQTSDASTPSPAVSAYLSKSPAAIAYPTQTQWQSLDVRKPSLKEPPSYSRVTVDEFHAAQFRAADGTVVDLGVGRLATSLVSRNDQLTALGMTDGQVDVVCTRTGVLRTRLRLSFAAIVWLRFSDEGSRLAVADCAGKFACWDLTTQRRCVAPALSQAFRDDNIMGK